jgi:2-phosphosulfolactate phosphatase
MKGSKPALYTSLSPALLHLYDVSSSIVVIIDVLRATSTIATVLHNGAKNIIPVDSVAECIRIGKQIEGVTAAKEMDKLRKG